MKKSFVLYLDQYEPIRGLTVEQKGHLLDAMFAYHNGTYEEEVCANNDPLVKLAFSFFKQTFERDNAKYLKMCEKNKENARMRWDAKNATASDRISKDAKNADSESDKIVRVIDGNDKDRIQIEFDFFWDAFKKKKDKDKCLKKWKLLNQKEKDSIFKCVSSYVQSTPDPQFRKNPLTWLNGKCWNDEIIPVKNNGMKINGFNEEGYYDKPTTGEKNEYF